jgi:hypothetical protein
MRRVASTIMTRKVGKCSMLMEIDRDYRSGVSVEANRPRIIDGG